MANTEPPVERRRIGCIVVTIIVLAAVALALWGLKLL